MEEEGLVVVNFGHPLTDSQCGQIEDLSQQPILRVLGDLAQVDVNRPLMPQAVQLVDRVGLSAREWQTLPLVVNPPGLAPLAAALLAHLHGRMGYFPVLVRIRPVADAVPTRYEVAELLDLQSVRDRARQRRSE